MTEAGGLFLRFFILCAFAIGGMNSAMPGMFHYVVDEQGWLTPRQFTDLYALGMIAYEMCAGRSAFRADDLMAILTAQMADPPPPLPSHVPPPLAIVILSLLEKDPNARPQTAQSTMERLALVGKELGWAMPVPRSAAASQLDIFHMQPKISIATTALNVAKQFGMGVNVQIQPDLPPLGVSVATEGNAIRIDSHAPTQLISQLIAAGFQVGMQMQQGGQKGGPGGL